MPAISTLIPVRFRRGPAPRSTKERRLRIALANDNAGTWYVCIATRSVLDLERRFFEGSVASILYKTVGGILGDHKQLRAGGRQHYLYVQLRQRDPYVDLSLGDVGVRPLQAISFDEIRVP